MKKTNGGQPWGLNFVILQGCLGANIRLLRQRRSMSQKELALEAKITQSELSNIERMVANPSLEVATKIATALDVPFIRLFESELPQTAGSH
jgi:transcriptional regulator with XRE-family HTH domain